MLTPGSVAVTAHCRTLAGAFNPFIFHRLMSWGFAY